MMRSAACPVPVHSSVDFTPLHVVEDAESFNFSLQKGHTIIVIESCGASYFNLYCLAAPPDRLNSQKTQNICLKHVKTNHVALNARLSTQMI